MYIANSSTCEVNELCHQLFCGKMGNIESSQLPPCRDWLYMHALSGSNLELLSTSFSNGAKSNSAWMDWERWQAGHSLDAFPPLHQMWSWSCYHASVCIHANCQSRLQTCNNQKQAHDPQPHLELGESGGKFWTVWAMLMCWRLIIIIGVRVSYHCYSMFSYYYYYYYYYYYSAMGVYGSQ